MDGFGVGEGGTRGGTKGWGGNVWGRAPPLSKRGQTYMHHPTTGNLAGRNCRTKFITRSTWKQDPLMSMSPQPTSRTPERRPERNLMVRTGQAPLGYSDSAVRTAQEADAFLFRNKHRPDMARGRLATLPSFVAYIL